MIREPIITPYDINAGEVAPVWRYRLQTKVTPASDGTPFELVAEGDITTLRVDDIKTALQADLDYWTAVEALLDIKIAETESD